VCLSRLAVLSGGSDRDLNRLGGGVMVVVLDQHGSHRLFIRQANEVLSR
jgi:hypothetical protein